MTESDRIESFLIKVNAYTLDVGRRRHTATMLAANGLTVKVLRRLWEEAKDSYPHNRERAIGVFIACLRKPQDALENYRDLTEHDERLAAGPGSEESSVRNITPDNPYGWANPNSLKPFDHGRPLEWNGYRQCYNMDEAEREHYGLTDCRRKGSARIEVIGKAGEPPALWDDNAAVLAQASESLQERLNGRDIYL